jgi:aminomethyltransferase
MSELLRTALFDRHVALGAKMVEFAGWSMPLHYKPGIIEEHLATRCKAGLFDVSHMGRFVLRGPGVIRFLQYVLTNNAAALEVGQSQYTIIANEQGGAIDDAYLYRFREDEYLLVVNAANRDKDWQHFQLHRKDFADVEMTDRTDRLAMLSLQGPLSRKILQDVISRGRLPEPARNALSIVRINQAEVSLARTGYTGEPLCFELFVDRQDAPLIWDLLIDKAAEPVGLGARDTLRLEAALPLYGHELGLDREQKEIPVFASSLSKYAVSFSPLKGSFVGRTALSRQFEALKKIDNADYLLLGDLPRLIMPVAVADKAVARAGDRVFAGERHVGYVTSGTMVPYWLWRGDGLASQLSNESRMRAVALSLLDSTLQQRDEVEVEVRGKRARAVVVPYHLRSEAPPYARPVLYEDILQQQPAPADFGEAAAQKVSYLLTKTLENTIWRQQQCINLIPSEQTASRLVRLLSIMDPAGRYAEHRRLKAFADAEVFYYQGTDFIAEVEHLLEEQLRLYIGCSEVETRLISGQMANTAVFSALVDYLNRTDRKSEPRRIRHVLNHHIIKGGHLSAQPMGALRDFVARDLWTERPAIVNFPVLPENPYRIDVAACGELIARYKPELIIFGKSVMLHTEPVGEVRRLVDELSPDCVIMYDMAHVLGLVGPYFQQPFLEGTDIVTGSTHKTFFGTQRGLVAANYTADDLRWPLWEAIERRTFPGSVSNHHLGTLLGLLLAIYELNHFRDEYQKMVLGNAKAFACALHHLGMDVAGEPDIGFTQTHQVVVNVGYSRGPEVARRLEDNNIIVNYQASSTEEGFTAAGSLRMGVAEMTRFGMQQPDFQRLAEFICDVVVHRKDVKRHIINFRKQFTDMRFCFSPEQFGPLFEQLHKLV